MSRIPFVTENTVDVASDVNSSLLVADGLITSRVASMLTAPPASATDGLRVAIMSGATGIFAGRGGQLGTYVLEGSFWIFHAPVLCAHSDALYMSKAGSWVAIA